MRAAGLTPEGHGPGADPPQAACLLRTTSRPIKDSRKPFKVKILASRMHISVPLSRSDQAPEETPYCNSLQGCTIAMDLKIALLPFL